jgi:L-threonylcarbamoyladenylate synthase
LNKYIYHEINNAALHLKQGNVVIYPTDTLWAIGCTADNDKAIEKIFNIKKRNIKKSFIILVDSLYLLDQLIYLSNKERKIINKYKKPLTIIYNKIKTNHSISQLLINKNKTLAIRVTKNFFCKKIINILQKPIISTSANISNSGILPDSYNKIPCIIKNKVDYIVNLYKKKKFYKPSTIVKVDNNKIIIIRK